MLPANMQLKFDYMTNYGMLSGKGAKSPDNDPRVTGWVSVFCTFLKRLQNERTNDRNGRTDGRTNK